MELRKPPYLVPCLYFVWNLLCLLLFV